MVSWVMGLTPDAVLELDWDHVTPDTFSGRWNPRFLAMLCFLVFAMISATATCIFDQTKPSSLIRPSLVSIFHHLWYDQTMCLSSSLSSLIRPSHVSIFHHLWSDRAMCLSSSPSSLIRPSHVSIFNLIIFDQTKHVSIFKPIISDQTKPRVYLQAHHLWSDQAMCLFSSSSSLIRPSHVSISHHLWSDQAMCISPIIFDQTKPCI